MSDRDAFRAEPGDDLKTPDEWCKLLGYEVMDPDGWRGGNGRPWTDPISQAEFEARIVTCTLRRVDPRSTFRAAQQERRLHGLKARHETREARAVRSDPVKALRYLLAQYDRVVDVHEHVVMDTAEDRELHDRAVATFREAAEPIRTALADSLDDLLTASEVKVLTETATRLGRELGRREAGEQIAVRCEQDTTYDTTARWYFARIARNSASPAARATSDATSGVPGHPEVSEAVRSPQEPGEGS